MIARLWWLVDRRALLVTAACFAAWRVLLQIPIVLVPPAFIDVRLQVLSGSGWFAAIGPHSLPMSAYSIGVMGLSPYINAMVIVSVVRLISSRVEQMARTPDGGLRLTRWLRALTILLALGQAYGFTVLVQNQGALPSVIDWSERLAVCLQLTAGTVILLLIAEVLDEHGLGYGYGGLILYALQPVGGQFHHLADVVAHDPSAEALLRPLLLAAVLALAMTAGTIALWFGIRKVVVPADDEDSRPEVIYLRVLASGVLRPPLFAISAMFLPIILANYYTATGSQLADWVRVNWRPDGPEAWANVIFIVVESLLVIGFAYGVTVSDLRSVMVPAPALHSLNRLLLVGGAGLALITVVVPVLEELSTEAVGQVIPLSGLSVALGTVMLLITTRRIEGRRAGPELAVSPTYLP